MQHNRMREKVEELREAHQEVKLGGGADELEKQRKSGKLTARERIDALVDPESFEETGLVRRASLHACSAWQGKSFPADGVVTGAASVGGRAGSPGQPGFHGGRAVRPAKCTPSRSPRSWSSR